MSAITTHVLDTARGRPAGGVRVVLEIRHEEGLSEGSACVASGPTWRELGRGVTDDDGRLRTLLPAGARLDRGTYRLTFQTGAYFALHAVEGFYPEVSVIFEVRAPEQHYHVPVLLSPYGYSTYRGS